jgi:Asp-tRNA(Asn)/Glu-tRNA(Gln) amidotransferase A subunit family amidase
LQTLSRAGATVIEIAGVPDATCSRLAGQLLMADFPGTVARYFNRHRVYDRSVFGLLHELHVEALKKTNLQYVEQSATGEAYFDLVQQLLIARRHARDIMVAARLDVLVYPTTKAPNTPNDGAETLVWKSARGEQIPETAYGANMGFAPAMRIPSIAMFSGTDPAGLPLSITLDGYAEQDRRLLDIAEAAERVLPPLARPKLPV